ncbi:MAG: Flp pilus assembly protein TadG, partial [Alphaproteobacteria bacterium]
SNNSSNNLNLWQGIVGGTQRYATPLNTSAQGPNLLCPQEVTRMTTNKTTLTNAINGMVADGNTVINQGLQWGWNMISPRWRGMWGGTMNSNSLPLDYHTKGMNKAVVLLTDGENTIDNMNHSAYWYLADGRLGTTSSSAAVTQLNTRTAQLCTAMKAQGIYIYTIALGTGVTTTAKNMLKACATAENYYFNSPGTAQLQTVFSAIGDSLSNLRVSK